MIIDFIRVKNMGQSVEAHMEAEDTVWELFWSETDVQANCLPQGESLYEFEVISEATIDKVLSGAVHRGVYEMLYKYVLMFMGDTDFADCE